MLTIDDYYDFHEGLVMGVNKQIPVLGGIGAVPHNWLIRLRDEQMAAEFSMKASWDEHVIMYSSFNEVVEFYTSNQLSFPAYSRRVLSNISKRS